MHIKYNFILFLGFLSSVELIYAAKLTGEGDKPVISIENEEWIKAAFAGDLETIKKLLGKVNVNYHKEMGMTALGLACSGGYEELLRFLLTVPGIDVNLGPLGSPLSIAARGGNENIVKLLLQVPNINIVAEDRLGNTALSLAMEKKYSQIAKLIQEKIVALAAQAIKAMDSCTKATTTKERNDNAQIVQSIVAQIGENYIISGLRADPKTTQEEMAARRPIELGFQKADWKTHKKRCKAEQKDGIDMLPDRSTAKDEVSQWFEAIGRGNLEAVQKLSQHIDVNIKSGSGSIGLTDAVFMNREHIVKFLLTLSDINVNIQISDGYTALIWAAHLGHENLVKLLLSVPGINITARDSNNKTALILSIERNHPTITKLIQDKINELAGRAFDAISAHSKALTEAERHNAMETLKTVVTQIGVNDIVDGDGHTLVDKAFIAHNHDIALFLLKAAHNPKELLARFPFELINPTSDLFKFCLDIAYNNSIVSKESTDAEAEAAKECAYCGKQNCTDRCGKCQKVYYCSVECQKNDWQKHKQVCAKRTGTA